MKLQPKYADLILNLLVAVAISLVVNFSYVLLMLVDLNSDNQPRPAGERIVERTDEGVLAVHPDGYGYLVYENGDSVYVMMQRIYRMNLKDGDRLLTVLRLSGESNLLMITEQGMAIHFRTAEVSLIGRTAAGVKGIALAPEDGVGFVLPDDEEGEVLLVSDKGFMKRCLLIDFDLQARAGKGVKCFAFQKNGANGTRICAALLVKQPFDFVAKQKSGQEMPLNTNAVRIERRDSRGSMYAMCLLDDTIEFVERTIQRGN